MSDESPEPAVLLGITPISTQAIRLRKLLHYLSSDKPDWQRAIGPALATIDVMERNLDQIRKAILELEARGK